RALRLDKMFLAGLERVLLYYLKGEAIKRIPVWQMISTPLESLHIRAEKIGAELNKSGIQTIIGKSQSTIGGGSLPGETLPSITISVIKPVFPANQQAQLFRQQTPPVIGRIEGQKFVLDLRTVFPHQDESLISAIKSIFLP
ncbi:MAG TPA: L-seryl-tRNA(Sec) selenium transferase, partial [candidate division Zixibacteria bacterium]